MQCGLYTARFRAIEIGDMDDLHATRSFRDATSSITSR
jgi:hypothetical protein